MAPLAPLVETLADVPEALRQYYEPKDGKFALSLSATPPGFVTAADHNAEKAKVVEFRDNNILLKKENGTLTETVKKFEGIDPVVAKEAITQVEEFKKKGAAKPDDVATLVKEAVAAAVAPLQTQIKTSQQAAEAAAQRADESTLRSVVSERFVKAGGVAKALDYIVGQAKGVFTVKDGKVVAQENKFSTANPGEPLDLDEWMTSAAKEHDFAFKASSGGGAPPAGGGGGTPRPAGQIVYRNPTPQQLGDQKIAKEIKEGKARFEYDNPTVNP